MEQIPKKVFILANEDGEDLGKIIYGLTEELKIPIELKISEEEGVSKLPKDYDIYFLHVSQIEESNVREVHNNQPWSYFVGLSGDEHTKKVRELFNELYYIIKSYDIEHILKNEGNLVNRT